MKRVLVLYGTPKDPAHFERHYREVHVPLVHRMPALQGFEVSRGVVVSSLAERPVHFVAILTYASQADLERSLGSPEGQAAVADLSNFASGGAQVVTIDSETLI